MVSLRVINIGAWVSTFVHGLGISMGALCPEISMGVAMDERDEATRGSGRAEASRNGRAEASPRVELVQDEALQRKRATRSRSKPLIILGQVAGQIKSIQE